MYKFIDLIDKMPLSGSFDTFSVAVMASPCHTKMKTEGFDFGNNELKLLRDKNEKKIFTDSIIMKRIYLDLVKLLKKLSTNRKLDQEQRFKLYKMRLITLIEKNFDSIAGDNSYIFASLCLPVYLGETHSCHCGENGAKMLLSLADNTRISDEY